MKVRREWKKVFENDLEYIVNEFKDSLTVPSLILLEGPVGAGKTTFMKMFVDNVSPSTSDTEDTQVVSPTYSLIQEVGNVAHGDFYRIQDAEEIIHLELPLYLEEKEYFVVEWGKKFLKDILKEVDERFNIYCLTLSINSDHVSPTDDTTPSRNFVLEELTRN